MGEGEGAAVGWKVVGRFGGCEHALWGREVPGGGGDGGENFG